jgi:hypothetical protein
MNYIRPWGICQTQDTEEILEADLIEHGVKTREDLQRLLDMTKNLLLGRRNGRLQDGTRQTGIVS